jgi:hypothetical protein
LYPEELSSAERIFLRKTHFTAFSGRSAKNERTEHSGFLSEKGAGCIMPAVPETGFPQEKPPLRGGPAGKSGVMKRRRGGKRV